MNKKSIIILLFSVFLMATPVFGETIEVEFGKSNLEVDGKEINKKTFSYGGTTYIAIRDISELLGANLDWNQESLTANIEKTGNPIILNSDEEMVVGIEEINGEINKVKLFVDNKEINNTLLYNNITYGPLRDIVEGLGGAVDWLEEYNTISIISNKAHSRVLNTIDNRQKRTSREIFENFKLKNIEVKIGTAIGEDGNTYLTGQMRNKYNNDFTSVILLFSDPAKGETNLIRISNGSSYKPGEVSEVFNSEEPILSGVDNLDKISLYISNTLDTGEITGVMYDYDTNKMHLVNDKTN